MNLRRRVTVGFITVLLGVVFFAEGSVATPSSDSVYNIDARNVNSLSHSDVSVWRDLSPSSLAPAVLTGKAIYSHRRHALNFRTNRPSSYEVPTGFANFTSGISVEFRASFGRQVNNWERIIDFGNADGLDNIIISRVAGSDEIMFETWSGSDRTGRAETTNSPLRRKRGMHTFAATLGTDRVPHIYIDGKRQPIVISWSGSPTHFAGLPSNTARSSNYIGKSNWVDDQPFEGFIQYIRIYDYELSPQTVLADARSHY